MNELKDKGTTQEFIDKMIPFSQFNELIGLPKIRQLEDEYLPKLTK